MKHLSLIFLCLYKFVQLGAQNYTVMLNERDLGVWAWKQHIEIVRMLYPALQQGKLIPYSDSNAVMKKELAYLPFANKVPAYKVWPKANPYTTQPDTFVWDEYFFHDHTMIVTENQFKIQGRPVVCFDKAVLYKMLSPDNRLYLETFAIGDTIKFGSIPSTSRLLLMRINTKLFSIGRDSNTVLYADDTMNRVYDHERRKYWGMLEKVEFKYINPGDSTEGYDSIYPYGYPVIEDCSVFQAVFCAVALKDFRICGIGCGLPGMPHPDTTDLRYSHGFISYPLPSRLWTSEAMILDACLRNYIVQTTKHKWPPYLDEFAQYQQDFAGIPWSKW